MKTTGHQTMSSLANQAGQMTMEMMLLMMVFLMIALAVRKSAISNAWVQALVEGPWLHVEGMIEDGVWLKAGTASKEWHPSLLSRKGTVNGEATP